jgi:hypothetical protein
MGIFKDTPLYLGGIRSHDPYLQFPQLEIKRSINRVYIERICELYCKVANPIVSCGVAAPLYIPLPLRAYVFVHNLKLKGSVYMSTTLGKLAVQKP